MRSSQGSETFSYHSRVDSQIFDNHVKTLSEAVGMVTSRIACVEQTVNALSQDGIICNIGTERQHSYRKYQLSLHAYAKLRRMRRSSPVVPTRQDHGTWT